MKKIILTAMLAALVFGATACSGSKTSSGSSSAGTIQSSAAEAEDTTAQETTTAASDAIAPGSYVEHDGLKFSFESAKQYDEIAGDYYSDTPDDGKKYLVLFFEIENTSSEDEYINMYYFDSYLDDYDIDTTMFINEPEGYSYLSGNIAAGKKLKGYVAYEVDSDWQKLEVTYTNGMTSSSPTYKFVVTPDALS